MDDDQQFCLRWNNHQSTLVSVFDSLLEKGMHVDCTLAAEGQTLKAHKVVLSACSPYFESVLSQQYDKHPIIILKDVKYAELRAMMDYMYRGEVNISQDQLAALLKAAESLQIKGLSDNKPSRPPSRPPPVIPTIPPALPVLPAHQPRVPSPPVQVRDGSIDSREGSESPTRRRKKMRRISTEVNATPVTVPSNLPPAVSEVQNNGVEACKEEIQGEGVEDLTLDEETEEQPSVQHNDVRNFQWHMERSQDEIMNSSDSIRDSQELHKETHLPSALLSLLSVQHVQGPALATLMSPCIQVTNIMKPTITKEVSTYQTPLHIQKLPVDASNSIPENIKTHFLQQAFMQNNNTVGHNVEYKSSNKQYDESDIEYDDTDDIVIHEDSDNFYDSNSNGSFTMGAGTISANDMYESTADAKVHYSKRDGNSSDDSSRQFECRHCGKRYRWKSTLRRHENVECGGKAPSHQCPYCSYKAKQRGNLGVHIRKHHNNEWHIYASNKVRRNKKTSA